MPLKILLSLAFLFSYNLAQASDLALESLPSPPRNLRTKVPAKVAKILRNKCGDCHSNSTMFPPYADLPIIRDLIEHDIEEGRRYFNMETEVFLKRDKNFSGLEEIPIATLNRIESVVQADSMPPIQYKIAHWDKILNPDDRKTLMAWVRDLRGDIIKPIAEPSELSLDPAKLALGEALFHDKRLSVDDSISCSSCHNLSKGGTDQSRFSTGVKANKGHINSPTVYNAVYNFKQFWDGRAATLAEQAAGPVHNPIEMASNWDQVSKKLSADPEMLKLFEAAYKSKEINGEKIAEAIATFEESLITPSRFDKYLRGDNQALSSDEKKGYVLFQKHNCTNCHSGPGLGGQSFEKMGLAKDYFADRVAGSNGLQQMPRAKEDYGRFNVSRRESDRYKFKVPLLRKLSSTFPYFHDGNVPSIEEAVRIMGDYQLGKKLSSEDIRLISKFLKVL